MCEIKSNSMGSPQKMHQNKTTLINTLQEKFYSSIFSENSNCPASWVLFCKRNMLSTGYFFFFTDRAIKNNRFLFIFEQKMIKYAALLYIKHKISKDLIT